MNSLFSEKSSGRILVLLLLLHLFVNRVQGYQRDNENTALDDHNNNNNHQESEYKLPEQQQDNEQVQLFDWTDLRSDIEAFLKTSLASTSCEATRAFCSSRPPQPRRPRTDRNDEVCRCDPTCVEYGDCCFDMAQLLHNNTESLNYRRRPVLCKEWLPELHVYMVGGCPEENDSKTIAQKCSMQVNDEEYTYHLDVPVRSEKSGNVYTNIFCAICHNDSTNITTLEGQIDCNNEDLIRACGISVRRDILSPEFYRPSQLKWTRNLGVLGVDPLNNCSESSHYQLSCKMSLRLPDNFTMTTAASEVTEVRRCRGLAEVVDDCPNENMNYCKLYGLTVVDPETGLLYSNPHCAQCNGIAMNATKCSLNRKANSAIDSPKGPELLSNFAFSSSSSNLNLRRQSPYLSVSLDFTNSDGKFRCTDEEQLWDPLTESCYNVTCGFLFENRGGDCHYRNITQNNLLECNQTEELDSREIFKLSNGSILRRKFGRVYNWGEYEIYYFTDEFDRPDRRYRVCANERLILEMDILLGPLAATLLWISIVGLCVHIFIHTTLEKLRNPPAQMLLALTCALAAGQFFVASLINYSASHSICIFVASCLHYFYLVSSFWMNVLHFDLCRIAFKRTILNKVASSAREVRRSKVRFKIYSYYAWGVPVVIVAAGHLSEHVPALADYRPDYAASFCWINSRTGLALFFALPMATLLLENCIFISITVVCLLQRHKAVYIQGPPPSSSSSAKSPQRKMGQSGSDFVVETSEVNTNNTVGVKFKESDGQARLQARVLNFRFGSYGLLGLVIAITWITAFAAVFSDNGAPIGSPAASATSRYLWYPFVILHGLQGVVVFLLFDLKKKIYYMAYEKVMGRPHPAKRKHRLKVATATSSIASALISATSAASARTASSGDDLSSSNNNRTTRKSTPGPIAAGTSRTTTSWSSEGRSSIAADPVNPISASASVEEETEDSTSCKSGTGSDDLEIEKNLKTAGNPLKKRPQGKLIQRQSPPGLKYAKERRFPLSTKPSLDGLARLTGGRKNGEDLSQYDAWQQLRLFQERLRAANDHESEEEASVTKIRIIPNSEDEDEFQGGINCSSVKDAGISKRSTMILLSRDTTTASSAGSSLQRGKIRSTSRISRSPRPRPRPPSCVVAMPKGGGGRRSVSQPPPGPPKYINPPPYRPRARGTRSAERSVDLRMQLYEINISDDESYV